MADQSETKKPGRKNAFEEVFRVKQNENYESNPLQTLMSFWAAFGAFIKPSGTIEYLSSKERVSRLQNIISSKSYTPELSLKLEILKRKFQQHFDKFIQNGVIHSSGDLLSIIESYIAKMDDNEKFLNLIAINGFEVDVDE
ncbi:MAG: hypothetical protein WCK98_03060 [bacterium]